ncbi:MAG: hypothetical protein HY599_06925, partial [Candidatus Omnitrophica bacterium]|nr:hypothetical protein [Candidatus Omnitrophota bacterium]
GRQHGAYHATNPVPNPIEHELVHNELERQRAPSAVDPDAAQPTHRAPTTTSSPFGDPASQQQFYDHVTSRFDSIPERR